MIILLLITLSFHLTNTVANPCNTYNITLSQQNDDITVHFLQNKIFKLDRTVQCTSSSAFEVTDGCVHRCNKLGYGQFDRVTVQIQHDNGTIESCSLEYRIELQPPSLSYLNITNNKVRLGINRPSDSFDYVRVQCSTAESYIIFNTSIPSNNSLISVDCSFLETPPLMNFNIETNKNGFVPAYRSIDQEVPLPINFTYNLNSTLLNIVADPAQPMNLYSTYEFQVIFHDKNTTYERVKVSNLVASLNLSHFYGLIPNVDHTIIFKHIANPIGYSQSQKLVPPIVSNISYPYKVTNLRVREEFDQVHLSWNDIHHFHDPIEYIVLCNSSESSMRKVGRNTACTCEYMTYNQTNSISVRTQITIPGYTHPEVVVQIDVAQMPEIPVFDVFNKTENSITIRWNYNNNSVIPNTFQYKIKCNGNESSIPIDIRLNQYQCQSLDSGTLYVISILLENLSNSIQRSKSINANTLLEKCQIQNHFYSPTVNGTRSVVIEWIPPVHNVDKVHVYCPSSYVTFEFSQLMRNMFVKCIVPIGVEYNVTFTTFKSGYESETIQFRDIPPVDLTTTTRGTSTTSTTTSTSSTTSGTSSTSIASSTTTETPLVSTTTTTSSRTPNPPTRTPIVPVPECTEDELLYEQATSTKWRTAAIVAFIMAGFLFLVTICLIVFSTLLGLRNRYNNIDE